MKSKTLPIGSIIPYDNNPRKISQEAVDAVKKSIEDFGYNVPILVDSENVILTGHTRLMALKSLGFKKVQVLVVDNLTPERIAEFRVLDNRIGEMSAWDHDLLRDELRAVGAAGEMSAFFSDEEVDKLLSNLNDSSAPPTTSEIAAKQKANESHYADRDREAHERMVSITCSHCGEQFFADSKLVK